MRRSIISAGILLLVFGGGFLLGHKSRRNAPNPDVRVQVDTLIVRDTIRAVEVKESRIPKGYELAPVGTTRRLTSYEELTKLYADSLRRGPELVVVRDTAYIAVPMSEYRFTDDTTFACAVRGYDVRMLWHESYVTQRTVLKTVYKERSKWGFGIAAGPGVLIGPNGRAHFGVGVTAGVRYDF